jgi:hypothetical protein
MHETETMNDVLKLDTPPTTIKEALRAHVEKALFKPLRPWERLGIVAVAVLCLILGTVCAVYFFVADALTAMQHFYLLITVPFAVAGAFWCISTLRRGAFHTMRDDIRIPAVVWAFLVVILVVEIIMGQPESSIVKTIAAIVVIGFPMTWDRMKASELRIQETVLRIALYKSDLSEEPSQDANQRDGGNP